ncbi:MAG: T9SS type A sorting domain-containing protein [Prolixibacteraceae bacterium]|nr:T9SS type A sorting domain-containing protein [Prolixibacteraceae bacterium]
MLYDLLRMIIFVRIIYPNPVEDYLYLNLSEPVVEFVNLEIADLTGKIIKNKRYKLKMLLPLPFATN